MNKITALIISNGRIEYLRQNINSLIKYKSDIFVVLNGENQGIINFLIATKKNYKHFDFFILNKQVCKSEARNIGIEKIDTDIIYFLDDDAFIESDNITILRNKFEKYSMVGVIGGPNITPPNSSRFQNISGIMLSTYLMTYKMSNRYNAKGTDRITDDKELILCNLAIKKELFIKYNVKFNNLLHYNEENLVLEQLSKQNVKMLFSPELKVYHHRRENMKSFLLQIYNSGKGRGIMSIIMPSSIQPYFFFPSMFVMYIILLLFGKMSWVFFNIYLIITIYNIINVYVQYKLRLLDIVLMFVISTFSHIYYGIGFIDGLIKGFLWKIKKFF